MVSDHIPDLPDLSKLSQIAQATSQRFKEINQRLLEFEQKLGALNLDLEVWVEHAPLLVETSPAVVKEGDESKQGGESETCVYLGWKKSSAGKSRLFYKTVYKDSFFRRGLNNEERPLLEAPWKVRVEALGRMKDLISLLEGEAKRYLDELESKLLSVTTK